MTANLSRRSARDALKLASKAILRRTVASHDVDLLELADSAGVTATMPSRWASRKCGDVLSVVDLVLVGKSTPAIAHDVLRWIGAELGFIVAPRFGRANEGHYFQHLANLARESGEAIAALAESVADGHVSDAELDRVDHEVRDLEEVIACVRGWIEDERARRAQLPKLDSSRSGVVSMNPEERRRAIASR